MYVCVYSNVGLWALEAAFVDVLQCLYGTVPCITNTQEKIWSVYKIPPKTIVMSKDDDQQFLITNHLRHIYIFHLFLSHFFELRLSN